MMHPKSISDLACVLFAPISHDASPADDLEIGDLGKLRQKIVLDTIGKGGVFFVVTQIFKWKDRDCSCCRATEEFAFPNDHTHCCYQAERQCYHCRSSWISLQPFFTSV